MTIRRYRQTDREDVRYICLNSDGPCDSDEKGQHFLLTTYCDYYIEYEPHNCFVCADDNDRAVGYILCAQDFDRFGAVFADRFVPRIDEADTDHRRDAAESTVLLEKYRREYPAHLHIDLLPAYQRKGMGKKLLQTLFAHLREQGVDGVMLSVWNRNTDAQRFYDNNGFCRLGENAHSIAFGIKLV